MTNIRTRIFIINQTDESYKFGIGRYISEMVKASKNKENLFELVIVTIGVLEINKLKIRKEEGIKYLDIPRAFHQGSKPFYTLTKQYSMAVFCVLADLFVFTKKDIFHFNNNMQYFLMKEMKQNTMVRIVYTIHVSLWKVFFNNDKKLFLSSWKQRKKNTENTGIASIEAESKNCVAADFIICLTKDMVKDIVELYGVSRNKVKIVPNGINKDIHEINQKKKESLRSSLTIKEGTFIFLYAGRLTEQKGIKTVLKAYTYLSEKINRPMLLLVVGEGPLRKTLENIVRKNKVRAHFTGYVSPLEMPQYYSLSNTLIFPSLHEQSSYVILEAMKYKLPMVLSDIAAFQYLKSYEHCLKVEIEDGKLQDGLINAMAKMLKDSNQRKIIAKNAHALFLQEYTSSKMFEQSYDF